MKISAFSIEKTFDYGLDTICDYTVKFDQRMGSDEFERLTRILNSGGLELEPLDEDSE